MVPGLLQTADYIRGVMRGGPHTLSDEQVEQRVKLRLDRQQRLTADDPPILDAIIDEGALLRPVGDHVGDGRRNCATCSRWPSCRTSPSR